MAGPTHVPDASLQALVDAGFVPVPVPVAGGVDLGFIRFRREVAEIIVLARYGRYRVLRVPTRHRQEFPFEHADPLYDEEMPPTEALGFFITDDTGEQPLPGRPSAFGSSRHHYQ
jgi:hypothetical protein